MNVPSRLSIWFSVFVVCIIAVPLTSFISLFVIAWFRASSPVEWEFARSTIKTYEPAAFGLLFLFIGIVPVVIALLYHGKRLFVEKYRAEWREHEDLKRKIEQFRELFPDGNVHAVLEGLRAKRLAALKDVRRYADRSTPEEMKAEDAQVYQNEVSTALSIVMRLEDAIHNARYLATKTFGLTVAPSWYYLCPKPDYPPDEAIAMQADAERKAAEMEEDDAETEQGDYDR